jgi:hypothetical protein
LLEISQIRRRLVFWAGIKWLSALSVKMSFPMRDALRADILQAIKASAPMGLVEA